MVVNSPIRNPLISGFFVLSYISDDHDAQSARDDSYGTDNRAIQMECGMNHDTIL